MKLRSALHLLLLLPRLPTWQG
uniref:Uncharacterized protein n=1 Tax=Physcomitrium patens TaxID=3218 RepID=A0A2K1IID6_PHYPA|nr:hypothetical protein PHYPA_027729 [Physcomitrium patens]